MSLQFVFGGSGSGKSTYVFEKVIQRSMEEEKRNFLIVVPDQFTMQTQMDLVMQHPRGGIMNIDVLSFGRLSYRILEETGGNRNPILDDTGKSLVLRKVAENLKEDVPVLGSHLKKIGYIHEVKSAISEFMQYGIGQDEMNKMMQFSKNRGSLYGKLQDLNTLYKGFLQYIQDKFITTEETYDRLAVQLEKSNIIRNSVVVLDGFTGFTPVQNRVIEKLLHLADEVIVTITIDKKEWTKEGEQQLFSLSKKTITSLQKLAENVHQEVKEPIWLHQENNRFQEEKALAHLEQHLFRYPFVPFTKKTDSIHILEADNMEEEVKQTCFQIRELLKEGYCYRDIAVITGDSEAYSSLIEEMFSRYSIPFFLDQTRGITLNPFIEYIRSGLQVVVKHYTYESVFHYLRSGMLDISREQVDKLENYVIALGIKGKNAWSKLFIKTVNKKGKNTEQKEFAQQELDELNAVREFVVDSLSVFTPGKHKVQKLVEKLYEFLTVNECQQKLKKYEETFAKQGDKAKEKEYAQVYRLVMDLLDQIASLLGEETMSWEEFAQILDAGFGEIQVGIIPQAVDQVVVGDMERTRLKQVKALFFLGVNDGKIPKAAGKGGILSDIDREFLAGSDTELSPTPRQQMFIQKFYLYLNVTKPAHKLYLSYAKLNTEGKSLKPSYFIETIQKLFPAVQIEKKSENLWENIRTMEEGLVYSAELLKAFKMGSLKSEEEEVLFSILSVLQEENQKKGWVEDILDAVFYIYSDEKISKEAARLLYGTMIHSSVSRLEKMAACAYAHFLQYGLDLKERQEFSFQAVDMGNVFHGVLEIFAEKLGEKNYTWISFPKEEGKAILKEALEIYAVNYQNTILFASARNAYALEKMERILWRTVETIQYQLQKGKFLPANYEISFSVLEDLDAVSIQLSEEEKMRLGGRIDRMDTYEDEQNVYVKVVDYKSGNQKFNLAALYYGLQLQLVVYLNAAMELEKKKHPKKKVVPGAFVYYHIADPMVDGEEGMTEEEVEQQIRKQLRVSGIVNSDPVVLESLDKTHEEKSDVIPIEYKKDGTLSSRSSVMTEEEIELIQKFAGKKAAELGRSIAGGNVAVTPCNFKEEDSCTFCQFKSVCAFDARIPGYEKRKLEDIEEEELWKKIRKEVEE